eukprot:TRINITY_DN1786_c0_g1_i2.p1 TRINITY_DN1786_c0_g1~~TRINITY_DN1786_c0_g1_i2.p1  ORF type:complete len:245 (-),score=82.44 TRINITY_DN1786_c0_g1_i2:333-1067(-)
MQDKTGTIRYFCQNCGSCPQFNSMDGVHCTCGHKSSIHAVKPSPQFNQQFNQMPLPQQQFNQQMPPQQQFNQQMPPQQQQFNQQMPPQQQFNQQMPPQQQQFNQQMPPQIKYDLDDKNIPRGNCFTCSCKRYVPRINQRGICSSCRHTGIQHVDATPKPVVIMQPPMPNPNMNNPIPNQNFNPNPSSIVNNQQHPGQNNNNNNNNCEKNDKCRECRLAGCTKDVNPGFDYCCRQHGIYGQKAGH